MVFSSLFFLFYFLPVVLAGYFVFPKRLRNLYLLLASLYFYAWGEGLYVLLMLFVVLINYGVGILLDRVQQNQRKKLLALGIGIDLLPLLYYKYGAFLSANLGLDLQTSIHLPIGISFFTFQALSYLVDTYKKTTAAQKNIIDLGLYIALFPQLIAGPIVRYHDISKQLHARNVSWLNFNYGVERFIKGLAKKVLLANPLGLMADIAFNTPETELSALGAWIGAVCYTLQIFYDFSGYSDMAIGLGRMFGFTFLENFNAPYISKSIQEFWRRWHISLSNWFRDYLYIPLGGNRRSSKRTIFNLFTVFFLCGLWHGASWNFVVWGLFHGTFLAMERGPWGQLLKNQVSVIRHAYVLLVVIVGWVFFRAETLTDALQYLANMAGSHGGVAIHFSMVYKLDVLFLITFAAAVICLFPLYGNRDVDEQSLLESITVRETGAAIIKLIWLVVLLVLSISALATDTYNPFIYFRF